MFHHLGRFTSRFPKSICLTWVILGVVLALIAPQWDTQTQDDDVRFVPERFTSVRALQLMEKAFPEEISASLAVFALERSNGPLTDADLTFVNALAQDLERLRRDAPELKLGKVQSYNDNLVGFRMTSGDHQCTLLAVSLETPYLAIATQTAVDRTEEVLRARLKAGGPPGLTMFTTGAAGIGRDLTAATCTSLGDTTLATIVLVIVVLLLVYRAPLLALVPLATIAFSVWISLNLLALMTQIPGVHLVNISKIFAIVILYGAGTDYCLFLIGRYREELEAGYELGEALARGVGGVGEALAASAGTVMVGLGLMAFAEFAKVRYAGPAIALSLGIALIASLTLTPALLRLAGAFVFWPMPRPKAKATKKAQLAQVQRGFWEWLSHRVARYPAVVWTLSVLIIMPLVVLGVRVKPNYRATGELSDHSQSLLGLAAIQRHFNAGEIGPITVLLASETDWSSWEGELQIDHLSRGFSKLNNVAEVRSFTQPLGLAAFDLAPPGEEDTWINRVLIALQPTIDSFRETMRSRAHEHYIAQINDRPTPLYVTRLEVILNSDPFDGASAETLQMIQTWLRDELPRTTFVERPIQAECFGITANGQDLAAVSEGDRVRVDSLVLSAIFLLLLVLVRKLWLAAYLLVTVLASYFAALGATVLLGMWWTGASLTYVDWRVPFFLFTILVSVGEDYNILLLSRALEEGKKAGSFEGMRRALARTGGSITSCGLIMSGTFATLMLGGLNTLTQIGFALAFGVLVDTFLVRPFLVPAFAMMVWRGQAVPTQTITVFEESEPDAIKSAQNSEIDQILDELRKAG